MNTKKLIALTIILLSASLAWAKAGFSLLSEYSLLAGKAIFDSEKRQFFVSLIFACNVYIHGIFTTLCLSQRTHLFFRRCNQLHIRRRN
ncbi:MAG: hypothetical protein FWE23_00250 [Chitinivibrionia bacterium]|nr:hypothetical protein [Chitinivibrionia bacterium]